MKRDNQLNKRDATRGGGVTAEAREEVEVEVKAPVDNMRQHNERGTEQEPEVPTE